MRTKTLLIAFCCSVAPMAKAAPGGKIYRVDKLDEAAALAKSEKLPLLFLGGASPEDFTKSAAKVFRNDAVMVQLERTDFKTKGLTPRLLGAFVEDAKQVTTSHLVFAAPDQSKVLAVVPGKMLDDDKAVKTLKDSLAGIMAGTQAAAVLPDTNWCWQSKDAASGGWIGAFSQVGPGEILVLRNAAGKKFQVPFSQLVPHHVEFAKSQGAAPEPYVSRVVDEYVEPGVEAWTNAEGKEIRGTFVSGEGRVLVLKLENGKEAKVPFDKLSETSRMRAGVLAIQKAVRPKK